jgi:hypothetical protein
MLPPGAGGFEDVGISADSQIAVLTGQSTTEPPVFIKAPFTTAGATITPVPIGGVTNSARGQGAVRFRPVLPVPVSLKITSIARLTNGHIVLQGLGVAGAVHTIQRSTTTPAAESFSGSLSPTTADGAGVINFEDMTSTGLETGFYRLTYP